MSRCLRFLEWVATVVALGCQRPGAEPQTAAAANDIPVGVYAATTGSGAGVITMGPTRDPIKPVAMIRIEGGATRFAGWIQP